MTFRDALGVCPKCGEAPFVAVHAGRPGMTISHCCYTVDTDNDDLWANADIWHACIDGYNDGYRDATPKWIPVSTMPDIPEGKQESTEVLAIDKSGYMHLAYLRDSVFCGIQWVNSASGLFYTCPGEITHWMPLPEPPEEEK